VVCQPKPSFNSRHEEVRFANFLLECADKGKLPMQYTTWNKSYVLQDPQQCDKRFRPDFVYLLAETKGLAVVVEFDEKQHSDRTKRCELSRMAQISLAHMADKVACIRWIRFNPHEFAVERKNVKCNELKRKALLLERLNTALTDDDYSSKLTIEYICYSKKKKDREGDLIRTLKFDNLVTFETWALVELGEQTFMDGNYALAQYDKAEEQLDSSQTLTSGGGVCSQRVLEVGALFQPKVVQPCPFIQASPL
jgi:hypothetical protein